MHFQEEPLAPVGEHKKKSFCVVVRLVCWFCVCVCVVFLPLNLFCPFFFFIALKCYFQQLLSYKYLLFFFSSFPPGEKGRGPIENSALSLSGEFKCGSNNRFLLLFFFKFPVVLLPRSALKENRKGSLECARLYSQRQNARLRLCEHMQDFIRTQTRTHTHTHTHVCLVLPVCVHQTLRRSYRTRISETGIKLGSGKSLEALLGSKPDY